MFKAIDIRTEEPIIILDEHWQASIDTLRGLDRNDHLVCQECRHPVRVKAGEIRIWHFAHKHRQDCSYNSESPLLLLLRAFLYKWLSAKFGTKVTLEKKADPLYFPRSIDCWVDNGHRSFAYWIFESGISSRKREALLDGFVELGIQVNWVFAAEMLRVAEEKEGHEIHLTTTERMFLQSSKFDKPMSKWGQSLHYLDHEQEKLTTYRGAYLVHEPQLYYGHPATTPLSSLLVAPDTGEFVHPGEYERYQRYLNKIKEIEKIEIEEKRLREEILSQPSSETSSLYYSPQKTILSPPQSISVKTKQSTPIVADQLEGRCVHCGEMSGDWWSFDMATNECRCNKCKRLGKY